MSLDGKPAAASANLATERSADDLTSLYVRLTALAAMLFILLVVAIAGVALRNELNRKMAVETQHIRESALRLEALNRSAVDRVTALQAWARNIHTRPAAGAGAGARAGAGAGAGAGASLDQAVEQALASAKGGEFTLDAMDRRGGDPAVQILGLTSASRPISAGKPSAVDVAVGLSEQMRMTFNNTSTVRWVYFYSANKDVMAVSPWVPSTALLGEASGVRQFLQRTWEDEVTTAGSPMQNPGRDVYWSAPHRDRSGAGLQVTVAAPVFWFNRFVGIVATDEMVSYLDDFLRETTYGDGNTFVVDQDGTVLAEQQKPGANSVTTIDKALPGLWKDGRTPVESSGQTTGDYRVFSTAVPGTDWMLVHPIERRIFDGEATRAYAPQMALALIPILAIGVVLFVLQRMYVRPAVGIANFVEGAAAGGDPEPPAVPGRWQPRVDAMVSAFRERRGLLTQLQRSNEKLEARVRARTRELDNQRRAAEQQSTLLDTVFQSMSDGVMILEPDGGVAVHNRSARTMLGRPVPRAPLKSWLDHFGLQPLDEDVELPLALLDARPATRIECRIAGPTGEDGDRATAEETGRILLLTVEPLRRRGRRLVLLHDITLHKRRQEELMQFAGTVAHDFKSPLTAVAGWMELAGEQLTAGRVSQAQASLERAHSAAVRLREVVDDWLAFSVSRHGVLQAADVPLQTVVRQVTAPYDAGAVTVVELAPHAVHADPSLLRQLVANICSNSVKYVRPGETPHLTISSIEDYEPGWIRVRIADQGVGIAPGDEGKIFGEYERSERDSAAYEGTGLGLALCRSIVLRHGGRIWAEQNPGGGSVICFTLPAAVSALTTDAAAAGV